MLAFQRSEPPGRPLKHWRLNEPGQSVGRRPRPPTNLRPDVLLIEAPSDEILPGIDGLLGTGPLIARHVNFDFVTGTLRWGMIR